MAEHDEAVSAAHQHENDHYGHAVSVDADSAYAHCRTCDWEWPSKPSPSRVWAEPETLGCSYYIPFAAAKPKELERLAGARHCSGSLLIEVALGQED